MPWRGARAGRRAKSGQRCFRHTYITARLQTLDRGAPVSTWTVAREVGHSSTKMIEATYGHLGEVRHRADVVEYRIEQHAAKLGNRAKMFAVAGANIAGNETCKSLWVVSSAG
jgi:hypothetical protein